MPPQPRRPPNLKPLPPEHVAAEYRISRLRCLLYHAFNSAAAAAAAFPVCATHTGTRLQAVTRVVSCATFDATTAADSTSPPPTHWMGQNNPSSAAGGTLRILGLLGWHGMLTWSSAGTPTRPPATHALVLALRGSSYPLPNHTILITLTFLKTGPD